MNPAPTAARLADADQHNLMISTDPISLLTHIFEIDGKPSERKESLRLFLTEPGLQNVLDM